MAIQTLYDVGENYQIDSKYDGAVYATIAQDCVCEGVGDQFTLHYSSNSLTAYFDAGSEAVIGGAFFKITSRQTLEGTGTSNGQLPSNSTFYLCARINLNGQNGQRGEFVYLPSLGNLKKDNLNGSGTQRDLPLYKITTGSSGVTSIENVMVVRGPGGASVSGIALSMNTDPNAPLLKVSKDLTSTSGKVEINFKVISESSYNALTTKDAKTLYFVPES